VTVKRDGQRDSSVLERSKEVYEDTGMITKKPNDLSWVFRNRRRKQKGKKKKRQCCQVVSPKGGERKRRILEKSKGRPERHLRMKSCKTERQTGGKRP